MDLSCLIGVRIDQHHNSVNIISKIFHSGSPGVRQTRYSQGGAVFCQTLYCYMSLKLSCLDLVKVIFVIDCVIFTKQHNGEYYYIKILGNIMGNNIILKYREN